MKNINNNIFFSRNKGLISETEQEQLNQTTIALVGAGGDGGLLAERLIRFGIGKLILTDPESFEPANINRQFAANQKNIGKNKAEAVADELLLINPNLEVIFYKEGITKENVIEINAVTGAEDFSYFAEKVPSLYFFIGGKQIGVDPKKVFPHHTPDFWIDESGMKTGIKAFCNLVFDYMNMPSANNQSPQTRKPF